MNEKQLKTPRKINKKPIISVIILFLVFLTPMFVAWYMVKHKDNVGEGTMNYGQLIQPPLKLEQLPLYNQQHEPVKTQDLKGKWLMLYVSPNACEEACQKMLYNMRQTQTATGKEMHRIQRALLTFEEVKQPEQLLELLSQPDAGTMHFVTTKAAFTRFIQPLSSAKLALTEGYLYLVDPNGNVMMSYPPQANPNGIYDDLKRLLKVSQIG